MLEFIAMVLDLCCCKMNIVYQHILLVMVHNVSSQEPGL